MLTTVDALVFIKDSASNYISHILLIKRGNEPFKEFYALPGGFPEFNELLVEAAKRELFEETGLKNIELKQLATFDAIGRDPRDRNISIAYYGFCHESNTKLAAGDDASEAKWFPVDNLPPLAFDHESIIKLALENVSGS